MRIKSSNKNKVDLTKYTQVKDSLSSLPVNWRYLPLYILTILIFGMLFLHLFNLQLIEGREYLLIASRTNQIESRVVPARGLIYDVNGKKLAYNKPSYTLFVSPTEFSEEEDKKIINSIANILDINKKKLWNEYKNQVYIEGKRIPLSRVTIKTGLSFNQYIDTVLLFDELDGVYIEVEAERRYADASYFAHILGYTGDPTQEDVDNGIYSKSQVGKVGIESEYDEYLRGIEGLQVTETGIIDHRERIFIPQEATPGENIYLTIDKKWQINLAKIIQTQINEVGAFAGAGVIMNSDTGEVKALVSLPSFDNNLFAQGISNSDFTELINDPHTPLLNRTIGLQLPPGSIFKVIGATAALEDNVITPYTTFFSDRCMELPGEIKFCEADGAYLGALNVQGALARSSNIFFCNVGLSYPEGISNLERYAKKYGIGKATGIDLSGEQKGTMASPELKYSLWKEPWYVGDVCNAIIGQGLVTVTPLQMTVVASAISNGGNIVQPRLMERRTDEVGNMTFESKRKIMRKLPVSDETFEVIRSGMRLAAKEGTAASLNGLPGNIIAKTGSSDASEIIQGELYSGAHSWVMGCFDYEDDNYCFVVMQQWGGRGYKTVPIMKKFINCLYNDFTDNCETI